VRADPYGIRTMLQVGGTPIKFEIVLEGRIELEAPGPGDRQCSVATLTPLDMATSKLQAYSDNSDRWRDDAVMTQAWVKAQAAYGDSMVSDLARAV